MTSSDGAVYVYGVIAADTAAAASGAGVGGSPVRGVRHEDVAALVSDVSGEALTAPREIRAHWRVLEEAAAETTVLPVRFGTVMESEEAVRTDLLAPNFATLHELLDELGGAVQLNIKGFYHDERLLKEIVSSNTGIASLRERVRGLPEDATYYERIRLGEAVAAEVERTRDFDSRLFLERLGGIALDAKSAPPTSPDSAVNLAFLVRRGDVDRFSSAVAEIEAELEERMRIRYVGPLPPYSFAEAELTAAAGEQGWG